MNFKNYSLMKKVAIALLLLLSQLSFAQNLIFNSDFEQGNTGFNSELNYVPNTEGGYIIATKATDFQANFSNCNEDHSPIGMKMLIANGRVTPNYKIWEQTVAIQPNKTYSMSFWYENVSSINDDLKFQMVINGVVIGQDLTSTITPCIWYKTQATWYSGNSTTAVIRIVDSYGVAHGNDFAIDDIQFEEVNLNSGLVAHYPFNGNANDESGNGNNGTINGATLTNDRFGNSDKAYDFNGVNNFIQAVNPSNFQTITSEITISAWVYLNGWYPNPGGAEWVSIVDRRNQSLSQSHFSFQILRKNNKDSIMGIRIPSLMNNTWYHALYTIKGGKVKVYINGIFIGETNSTVGLPNNLPLNIGYDPGGLTEYHNGKLDDIRIYSRSLSSREIKDLYYLESPNGSCVTWTNPPTTGSEIETATNDLCRRGIITTAQNGTSNTTTKITRGEIARLIFRALLADDETADARFPFLDFPTPYCDLRRANKNAEWYRAAMCLSYLEFGDGISPFSRKYFRFGADTFMRRQHFFQVLFESWNIKPAASTSVPFADAANVLDFYKKYIRKAADLGIATGTSFRPNDWLTVEEFYVFLYRLLKSGQNTPTIDQIDDEANYFIPANYTIENLSRLPKIDNGNFNHYSKTSFNLAGRGLPLAFTHTYNSFWTELPDEFFTNPDPNDETALNQRLNPLGVGWTHSYNISIQRVNAGNAQCSEGWLIFWADGSIHVYDPIARAYNTQGVYDELNFEDFAVDSQRVVITTKNQIRYTFTGKKTGKLLYLRSIEERNGNGLRLEYRLSDPNNASSFLQLSRVYEYFNNSTTGRALTFSYLTGLPFLQSVTDNIGRTISFQVNDETENLERFTDAKEQNTLYDYDYTEGSKHLLKTIKLPKGNVIQNTYVQRKLTSSQTSTGHKVEVKFQNNYRAGASGTTNYSAATVKTTQPSGGQYTTEYRHNLNGDPLSIATPASTISNIEYGTGLNIRKPTSLTANGQSVAMNYDTKGNLTRVMRENIEENFEYDTKNNLKRHIDARGKSTTYTYDGTNADRNLIRITRPTGGGTINMQRNGFGQIERVTNPMGIETQYDYDENGNLNTTTGPLSIVSRATYDNASRLKTTTDPKGYMLRFDYDKNDNVIEELDALNQRTTYGYDANENLTSITNAKNEPTTLTYSEAEDYLLSQTFGQHTDHFEYNLDGSLKRLTKPTATFNYVYDANGRTSSDGFTSYTYDSRNRITAVTYQGKTLNLYYDALDRLDYYTDYYGNTVDYGYDNNGNVTSIIYPTNKTVKYSYDDNNRLTSVTDWNNRILATYTYLTDDRLDSVVFHNGTRTHYGYDAAGRMTSLSNKRSNQTVISSYQFTLDKIGNHETETINEPAFAAAMSSLTARSVPYGSSPFNRLTSTDNNVFSYDGSGNQTQRGNESLSFDAYNRLTAAANAQYDYDGSGNRRSRTLNGTTTRYVLDILGMSQILMETNTANTPQYFYIYGASGLICRIKPDNTTHFYHYDFRGSTTAITDANQNITHQYSYDPFGKILASTAADANPFCYVGQHGVVYETANRYFMRARYYDPSVGRFLSEDPIWNRNLYVYAGNNPLVRIDPQGQDYIQICSGGSGNIGTGAGTYTCFQFNFQGYAVTTETNVFINTEAAIKTKLSGSYNHGNIDYSRGTEKKRYAGAGSGFNAVVTEGDFQVNISDKGEAEFEVGGNVLGLGLSGSVTSDMKTGQTASRGVAVSVGKSASLPIKIKVETGEQTTVRQGGQIYQQLILNTANRAYNAARNLFKRQKTH